MANRAVAFIEQAGRIFLLGAGFLPIGGRALLFGARAEGLIGGLVADAAIGPGLGADVAAAVVVGVAGVAVGHRAEQPAHAAGPIRAPTYSTLMAPSSC